MIPFLLFVEVYCRLIGHDRFMRRNTFASLHSRVKDLPVRSTKATLISINAIARSLDMAIVLYPKQVLCLQRSAVLVHMLRTRGVNARMMIGVQKLPFKAHAWVEVDGEVIQDRLASRERFLIVEVC